MMQLLRSEIGAVLLLWALSFLAVLLAGLYRWWSERHRK